MSVSYSWLTTNTIYYYTESNSNLYIKCKMQNIWNGMNDGDDKGMIGPSKTL